MTARKPTALKVLHGTFRADRAADEPQYSAKAPRPPASLSPGARVYWRELAELLSGARVLTAGDRQSLALTCEALEQHRAATVVMLEHGMTYTTINADGMEMARPRPEVTIADAAWKRAMRGLVEFGLTPASRTKVAALPAPIDNPFDFFGDGR